MTDTKTDAPAAEAKTDDAAAAAAAVPEKAEKPAEDTANADEKPAEGDPAGGEKKEEGGEGDPVAAYKPDGLGDHLTGASDQETIDRLFKAYKGARDELANKKGIPEKFEDYTVELSKEEEEKFLTKNEDGVDPIFELMKKTAYEHSIPQAATKEFFAKFAESLFSQVEEAGAAQAENEDQGIKADFDFKTYGGADKAKPVAEAANAWVDGLKTQGKIDDDAAFELKLLATHAGGLKALEALRVASGEKPIPVNMSGDGGTGGGALTEAQLHEKMRDPKYWKDKDPDFIKEVTDGFKQLYAEAS